MINLKEYSVVLADKIANFVGSWKFIILQSVILIVWMTINLDNVVAFDPYPFILMNLFLSAQAAYATPMILMSGNRQAEKDREHMKKDLEVDEDSKELLKSVIELLVKLDEDLKLDRKAIKDHAKILSELKKIKKDNKI